MFLFDKMVLIEMAITLFLYLILLALFVDFLNILS